MDQPTCRVRATLARCGVAALLTVSLFGPVATAVEVDGAAAAQVPLFNVVADPPPISFEISELSGAEDLKYTSLQFGPDERLYASDQLGHINAYTITRSGPNAYQVQSTESIDLLQDIPNHNDDGSLAPTVENRLVTGIHVTGSAASPVIYAASSDPRFGGGSGSDINDTDLDTNSSVLSRLTRNSDGSWSRLDLVRGLPRSEENHHGNGLLLDPNDPNILYLAMGGNTNSGAISKNFALLPEFALSAAILKIDLGMIGESTYDLPTLDDETRPGVVDAFDPFGGNNGLNQAKLVSGGPVSVHAPGFRNAYDIVITQAGKMFSVDNGPNGGWGGAPLPGDTGIGEGLCTNGRDDLGVTRRDTLHFIPGEGYYGGHPNPTRADLANTFNASQPQAAIDIANPIECEYRGTKDEKGALADFRNSTNGLVEYRASNLGGQLQGDLLAVALNKTVFRLDIDASGEGLNSKTSLFTSVGVAPLDITAQGDDEIFPGTVWVGDYAARKVFIFEPADYDGAPIEACEPTDPAADSDGDGFTNADEEANSTDPCSSASRPSDNDDDGLSDLNDADDDNDGTADVIDPFAIDAFNGRGINLPLNFTFENDSDANGGLLNMGFTGLMTDGSTPYDQLFDSENGTFGGAAGVFTIDAISVGDASGAANNQENAFQFGVDRSVADGPFVATTRVVVTPEIDAGDESQGLYVGTGDQDNFTRLAVTANGLRLVTEVNGVIVADDRIESPTIDVTAMQAADQVELQLVIDPQAQTIGAAYRLIAGDVVGERVVLAPLHPLEASWLESTGPGLAIGIIATAAGGSPFTATWDAISATPGNGEPQPGSDTDGDGELDATDPDDDNDGVVDEQDAFSLDAANGLGTPLSLAFEFDNSDPNGPLGVSGFTGLMTNDSTNYADQFDPSNVNVTNGRLSIATVTPGDPYRGLNTQENAFQVGVDVSGATAPYTLSTRLSDVDVGGFVRYESIGFYIGTGDQDNYSKMVVRRTGVQHLTEINRVRKSALDTRKRNLAVRTADAIELWLRIDPTGAETTVTAGYRLENDGVLGADLELGTLHALPPSWLDGSNGALAVGIISTSYQGNAYSANWDYLRLSVDDGTVSNTAPVAGADAISVNAGATASVLESGAASVLANDTDADGDALTAVLVDEPASGTLSFNNDGTFSYTHGGDLATTDSFSYRASDTEGALSTPTTVAISIGQPDPLNTKPTAVGESLSVDNGAVSTVLNGGLLSVLANDTDPEGDALTAELIESPVNGSLSLDAAGTFAYTHDGSATTTDSFTYRAVDTGSLGSDPATVDITILEPVVSNDPPLANDDSMSLDRGASTSVLIDGSSSVLTNDSDPDGDTISAIVEIGPDHGTLELNADGSFVYQHDDTLTTLDSFTYRAVDSQGEQSGTATVSISIVGEPQPGSDTDGDGELDATDPDDDNDGVVDEQDAFSLDAANGLGTPLSLAFEFDNSDPNGPLGVSGFTGLMTNDSTNYADQFDPSNVNVTNGRLSIATVTPGDPYRGLNTQENAFQVGVDVSGATAPYTLSTRLSDVDVGGFVRYESIGFYIGTGDQDNYSKMVVRRTGVQHLTEINRVRKSALDTRKRNLAVRTADAIELWLRIDPTGAETTVTAGYRLENDGVLGADLELGTLHALPSSWLDGSNGALAVGIISTSYQGNAYSANWDYLRLSVDEDGGTGESGDGGDASGWQAVATSDGSALDARHETGSVVVGNQLYVIGGRNSRPMQSYDPLANRWTNLIAPPMELHHFQPVHLDGKIYVVGAMTGGFPAEPSVASVHAYDIAGQTWEIAGTIPAARLRGGAGAVVRNDKIYIVGGNTNGHSGGAVAWFDEFDPATGTWVVLPDAPHARDHFQATLTGNRYLTVAGGRTSDYPDTFGQTVAATDVYDFNSGTWTVNADIPTVRAGTMHVGHGGEVWVMGGEIVSSGQALNSVEAFNPATGQWRTLPSMLNGRHGGGAGLLDGLIHVVSGSSTRGGGGEFDAHERIDPNEN